MVYYEPRQLRLAGQFSTADIGLYVPFDISFGSFVTGSRVEERHGTSDLTDVIRFALA